MHRITSALVAGFILVSSGCHRGSGFQGPSKRVEMTGAFIKEPISMNYAWVDFRDIQVNNHEGVIKLPVNKRILSPHIVKLELEVFKGHIDQLFNALVGPTATSGIADFAVLNSPTLKVYVASGWSFFWGRWPIIRTHSVYIGPESTTVLVEEMGDKDLIIYIDDSDAVHDIPLICDPLPGTVVSTTTTLPVLKRGQYIVLSGCEVSDGPNDYNTVPAYRDRVDEAKKLAEKAGYVP